MTLELADIISESTPLETLTKVSPSVWANVLTELRLVVENGESAKLGSLKADASSTLKRWSSAAGTELGKTRHACESAIKARMTLLAIDQFSDVMTGKAGPKPALKDRILLKTFLLHRLAKGQGPSTSEFDRVWKWLSNPLWAAGELQRNGIWSVPTIEFCQRIKAQTQGRPVLEIAAGRGLLSSMLHEQGVTVQASDDFSWTKQRAIPPPAFRVDAIDAVTALKTKRPSVVFCSWPPPGNEFERQVFSTPSVQLYIAIVSQHRFAAGDWSSYQRQNQFACTTSEPLNLLLRPIESQQQVLIFRRR